MTCARPDDHDEGGNRRDLRRTPLAKVTRSCRGIPPKTRARHVEERGDEDGGASASANKQVTALQARSDLAKDIRQSLADATSSKSCYTLLKKKLEVATDEEIQALELNPQESLTKHEDLVIKPLTTTDKNVAKMPLREVDAKKARPATTRITTPPTLYIGLELVPRGCSEGR